MINKTFFILMAAVVVSSFKLEELQDKDFNEMECDKDGHLFLLLPHHENCSKFYMCVFGVEVEFSCATDSLYFDFYNQTCAWNWSTTCQLRTLDDLDIESSGDGSGEGLLGIFEENSILDGIEDSKEVGYASSLQSLTQGKFNAVLNCDNSDIAPKQVAYGGDCQRFWRCVNGSPQALYCTDGLFFNSLTQQCDYEANVKCKTEVEDELQGEFIVYK